MSKLVKRWAVVSKSASWMIRFEPVVQEGVDLACRWGSDDGSALDDPTSCGVALRPAPRFAICCVW
jgi:hypothetical protein